MKITGISTDRYYTYRLTYSQKVFIYIPFISNEKKEYLPCTNEEKFNFLLSDFWIILLFAFFCNRLPRMQAKGKQILLQAGCPNLSVHGLLLL